MRLAVILPSRGLVYSRTVAEVLREVRGVGCEWELFMAHSRPIPACFNEPINDGLRWGATHFWLVEEDMAFPEGILRELIDSGAPMVAADYPVADGTIMCVNRDMDGKVRHTGTGCLFSDADTLRSVMPFRSDIAYVIRHGEWKQIISPPALKAISYGMHDIHLGMQMHDRGTPIAVIDTPCTQRRVVREATPKRNDQGWHDIVELPLCAPQRRS
jgi:hypothetical protein